MSIAAIIIILFFVPDTASGFKALGTMFNTLFGFGSHVSMIVGAIVVVLYTIMGGFMAVSTTDLIQGIVMSVALIAIVVFGARHRRGLADGYSKCTGIAGIFFTDPYLQHCNGRSRKLRFYYNRFNFGLGARLLWYATHTP